MTDRATANAPEAESAETTQQQNNGAEPDEASRFRRLAAALVRVPKDEIDKRTR